MPKDKNIKMISGDRIQTDLKYKVQSSQDHALSEFSQTINLQNDVSYT